MWLSLSIYSSSPALCVRVRACVRACATPDSPSTNNTVLELHYTILLELHYTILSLTVGRLSTISHTLNHTPHIETWTRRLTHHIPIQPNPTQPNPTQPNPTQPNTAQQSRKNNTRAYARAYTQPIDRTDTNELQTVNCCAFSFKSKTDLLRPAHLLASTTAST